MDEKPATQQSDELQGPYNAYILVAVVCGFASAAIVGILFLFTRIETTDGGLWALAAMVLAPAVLGVWPRLGLRRLSSCDVYTSRVSRRHRWQDCPCVGSLTLHLVRRRPPRESKQRLLQ